MTDDLGSDQISLIESAVLLRVAADMAESAARGADWVALLQAAGNAERACWAVRRRLRRALKGDAAFVPAEAD